MQRGQCYGTGYKRCPRSYLYKTLGLYPKRIRRTAVLNYEGLRF